MKRMLNVRVAGVTFENRQDVIARLIGNEPCRLVPEPENPYDKNAVRVEVATDEGIHHVGYIPRDTAELVAPHLDGENLMVKIAEITGGFDLPEGEIAAYGLRLKIELPEDIS